MEMKYRSMGKSGLKLSQFGLGGWATFGERVKDRRTSKDIIYIARDAGINFFDMADVYADGESEKMMGKLLQDFTRHELVISSKAYWPFSEDVNDRGLSRKHLMESVERSLKRIGTDYLDIYFCHRFDKETPLEETIRAMDDLVHQGKILYWGTSEWTAQQLTEAHGIAELKNLYQLQVEQPMYNLIARYKFEKQVRPVIDKTGMGTVTYSPLASGFLTGKYDNGIPENSRLSKMSWLKEWLYNQGNIKRLLEFKAVAEGLGYSRAQLAIAWAAAQPNVSSVLLGATSEKQIRENLKALEVEIDPYLNEKLIEIFPAVENSNFYA